MHKNINVTKGCHDILQEQTTHHSIYNAIYATLNLRLH